MDGVRIPACTAITLDQGYSTSGLVPLTGEQNTDDQNKSQYPNIGNKCYHQPKKPRFFTKPAHHKNRYPLIEEGKRRLQNLYYSPYVLPAGSSLVLHSDKLNKNGTRRKRRSEARENITHLVGNALLHALNMETLMIGMPSGKIFYNYSISYIARLARVSYSRAWRGLQPFIDAGYVTVAEKKTFNKDTGYKSRNPEISVSARLFFDLGISETELWDARNYKAVMDGRVTLLKPDSKALFELNRQYYEKRKEAKKAAKVAKRSMKEIMARARAGQSLTEEEIDLMNEEMPGWKRNHEVIQRPVYQDLSGYVRTPAASPKDDFYTPPTEQQKTSGLAHISNILAMLKKPPPS